MAAGAYRLAVSSSAALVGLSAASSECYHAISARQSPTTSTYGNVRSLFLKASPRLAPKRPWHSLSESRSQRLPSILTVVELQNCSIAYEVIGYTSDFAMASSHAIQDRCICHNVDEPQQCMQSKFTAEAMASFRIMVSKQS